MEEMSEDFDIVWELTKEFRRNHADLLLILDEKIHKEKYCYKPCDGCRLYTEALVKEAMRTAKTLN